MSADSQNVRLSILTITKNNLNGLEKTVRSVLSQTCQPHEFRIQDGMSADETLPYLKSLPNSIKWERSEDSGISDALNSIARKATGNWFLFLNAGDTLSDDSVISDLSNFLATVPSHVGVCHGNARLIDINGAFLREQITDSTLRSTYNTICHQATAIRSTLQLDEKYDARLKIGMDFDLWLRLQSKTKFLHFNRTICDYSLGGISSNKKWAEHSIIAHHMVLWLNQKGTAQLTWLSVSKVLKDITIHRLKKATEYLIGNSLYSLLKKLRWRK